MASEILTAWLLTVALHASLLLCVAWLLDRGSLRTRPAWREMIWRAAFFGGIVTASAQVLLDTPASARITLLTKAVDKTPAAVASESVSAQSSRDRAANDIAATHTPAPVQSSAASSPIARAEQIAADEAQLSPKWPPLAFPSWHLMLIAGWLAGALVALARLALAWLSLNRSLARAEPVDNAQLATDVAALAIQARIEPPRLAALDDLASPIAARGRRILLPRWAVELLDREQLRAMLAHETAHIARHDPEWKLAIAAWCALFWFVPLATLARRRLDEVAEISCDAWAAIHLGDGRSLAECLAECAERRIGGIDTVLAPAMAGRESPLLQRIDYLIAGVPMNTRNAGVRAALAVVAALAIAAFALPGVSLQSASAQPAPPGPPAPPSQPAPPAPESSAVVAAAAPTAAAAPAEGHHVHVSSDISIGGHDLMLVQVSDSQHSYSVQIDGKVEFNDSEDDIASLSDGGNASFSETHLGKTQRVDIASRGGKLERRYFVNDKEHPLDADAQKWMAALIPSVIRETAIDAEGRVKRLRAKGGADAVIDQIAHIDSGYARGVYLGFLAAGGKLTSAQMTRALGLVDAIDSDYEKRNALAALANVQPLDAAQQKLVLAQADKIKSDYERAELLVGVLPQLAPTDDVHAAWLKAASGIHSDYEHRRALSAMLDSGHADEATLTAVVDAAHTIGSDYERRELLISAVRRTRDADKLATAYAGAASKIGSGYERREALTALIHAQGFGKTGTGAVLDALSGIGSEYDCREVLVALAGVMPNDPALIARYRTVARRLSDYERGEAERALDHFTS